MREIEIKLKVKDLDSLEKELAKAGCVFSDPIKQDDVVYSAGPDSGAMPTSATEGHLAIRIRRQGSIVEFTLKQQKSGEMDNIEHETKVENPQAIHEILGLLGWKPQIEVKKIRKKAKFGKYEICLDKVEKLGNFMEIEKMTDDNDDAGSVRKELFDAVKQFGFSEEDEETRGYDTQIYQLEKK